MRFSLKHKKKKKNQKTNETYTHQEAGEMAQTLKRLILRNLNLIPRTPLRKLGMVVHAQEMGRGEGKVDPLGWVFCQLSKV